MNVTIPVSLMVKTTHHTQVLLHDYTRFQTGKDIYCWD